LQAIEAP